MKRTLLVATVLLLVFISFIALRAKTNSDLIPDATFAVVNPYDYQNNNASDTSFVFADKNGSYEAQIENVAFDPTSQSIVLQGKVTKSNLSSMPEGANATFYIQQNSNDNNSYISPSTTVYNVI